MAIDGEAAFKADAHAAEWAARLAGDRSSRCGGAVVEHCGGYGGAFGYFYWLAVDAELDQ